MKRTVLIILLLGLSFIFTSCTNTTDEKLVNFSVDEGKQIVNKFLTALVKANSKTAQDKLTDTAKASYQQSFAQIKAVSYVILDANELDGGAEYHGKILEGIEARPDSTIYDFVITMQKTEQGDYVISKLTLSKELEVKQKGDSLVVDEKGSETPLLSINDIPASASPKGAPDKVFSLGKKAFGPAAFSPDKSRLLISVNGAHGFIGSYIFDTREILPLDLYLEGSIRKVAWSPDGNLYAVQILNGSGRNEIILYDAISDDVYPFPGGDIFIDEKFDITQPVFAEDSFYFFVKADSNATVSGWWVYNFANKKLGKVLK